MAQLCLVHGQEHIRGPIFLRILIMPPEMDMMVVLFHDVYFHIFSMFCGWDLIMYINPLVFGLHPQRQPMRWCCSPADPKKPANQSWRYCGCQLRVGYDHVIMIIMSSMAPSHWCPFWASQFGQISELPTFEIWYGQNLQTWPTELQLLQLQLLQAFLQDESGPFTTWLCVTCLGYPWLKSSWREQLGSMPIYGCAYSLRWPKKQLRVSHPYIVLCTIYHDVISHSFDVNCKNPPRNSLV